MKIGLIDVDGTLPNLALMKISSFYKQFGCQVDFVTDPSKQYDKVFASSIFTRSKARCNDLLDQYGDKIEIGGTGWSFDKVLPVEIEQMTPDYSLYSTEMIAAKIRGIKSQQTRWRKAEDIVNAGMGFSSRGCVRNCGFCCVPVKEGCFRQETPIAQMINPRSNILILHDNNLTADPYCLDKLNEIRERKLIVDINQGIDVRLLDDQKAYALSQVKHLRSIHFAWDLMESEKQVEEGICLLTKYVKPYRQMCFMLVGFNTDFAEDMYRFEKLVSMNILPYVMRFNECKGDTRLNHFTRWVNSRIYKTCSFEQYHPWLKAKSKVA